jgi:hypothetical protein
MDGASNNDAMFVMVGRPYCPTWTVGGTVLNVDGGSWQELDYNEVRTMERWINTQGESACQALKEDRKAGTLQSMPTQEDGVQGLYKVCTREDV